MTIPQVQIPPLREDIAVKRYGGKYCVEDRVRMVRVPIDGLTLKVMEVLAEGPAFPEPLVEALEAPRAEVFKRVALLDGQHLLQSPRAAEQLAIHAAAAPLWPADQLSEAPLRYPAELRHGCVACGACCHGTDVGPLKPDDIDRIKQIDWSPHLPQGVSADDWLDEVDHPAGPITLVGMRHGRCVFLGDDKLCVIHKVAGAHHKPTICRQFPYTFTRTPSGVDVSLSMECRSWLKAKRNGAPLEQDEATIRALIAEGGPVLDLPAVVSLWSGVDLTGEAWQALRGDLLEGVRVATTVAGVVEALTAPVVAAFDEAHEVPVGYLARGAWGLPAAVGDEDPVATFLAGCRRVGGALSSGLEALAVGFDEADRHDEADRTRRVRWMLVALLSGRRVDDLVPFAHGVEIWRDLALASLYAHEPARQRDVMTGVSRLVLRILAGHLGSGMLAQAALRGRVLQQDVVDSMVVLTKMLRGSAFVRLLNGLRDELVALMVYNGGAFVAGATPRLPHVRLHIDNR
ncbi:MAG: hypothetical protein CSA66_01760 [Proteobacteria bacterium]|nr:MAG: hypothetical protein CSA66_01760 [Pseudomonadota bacterium]